MSNFTHLHLHTMYSLLDGATRLDDLFEYVKSTGQTAVAITDHGNLYGAIEFYKKAKSAGIKPIIGCEVYVAPRTRFDKNGKTDSKPFHLVLLAKNYQGYQNLMKLISLSNIDGFYYKPRVDKELLKKYSDGLIALSACVYGEIPSAILNNETEKAENLAKEYQTIFGENNFYLEIQNHGLENEKIVQEEIIKISKKLNIPLVATNDVHYLKKEDAISQDVLMCIQTNSTLNQENRMKFPNNEFYLKTSDEMREIFKNIPESIENTQNILNSCNLDINFNELHLPKYNCDGDPFNYLKSLCIDGAKEKYKENFNKISSRLDYELEIIKKMGYVDYFLIVYDFISYAHSKDIPVGPGRGSAAGSIVAYSLNITNVDPIKFNLFFERFLNPERISMPDIDIDFCYHRRQEVIDYVVNKYGKENVAQIITFGTLAAKAAIRDVGRVLELPYSTTDKLSKMIPNALNISINDALKQNKELKKIYDDYPRIKEVIDIAKSLEGMPRHASTHAAGIVITEKELYEYVPLQYNNGNLVAQFTMGTLEELGLLKIDFLGLKTLSVIKETLDNLNLSHDIFDSLNDEKTFNLIAQGETDGIFQLESDGMKNFLRQLKPNNIEDIIAATSLYRPGPMASIPKYLENKQNPNNIDYKLPQLKQILEITHGCIVYQEQVMQIVQELAGFTLGQADILRRAISKKKKDVIEKERINFLNGCTNNNVNKKLANSIFDEIVNFASYAFNKSHATAYSIVAYQTAYLKANYPADFFTCLLTSEIDNTPKLLKYLKSAKNNNIEILPCDINKSFSNFTNENRKIRFGLSAVKGIGGNFINKISEERNKNIFENFNDFCRRIIPLGLNKKMLEVLIKCGSFDNFSSRSQLLKIYEDTLKKLSDEKKINISGQISLFENEKLEEIILPKIKEFSKLELREMEFEILGFNLFF